MKRPLFWSIIFSACVVFAGQNLWAQTPAFPYIAQATADLVNVRAGQSENFEKLCQLKLAEQVIVSDQSYGWLKISLPSEAVAYIHSQYVLKINETLGLVNADRVNIRARPNVESTAIGQLGKGDQVKMIKQDGDWFQILPDENFHGWVKENFLQFFSKDVSQFSSKAKAAAVDADVKKNSAKVTPKEESKPVELKAEPAGPRVKAKGVLEFVSPKEKLPYEYKVVAEGKALYYLTGIDRGIDDFVRYEVQIEGVPVKSDTNPDLPVCKVEKIQLML